MDGFEDTDPITKFPRGVQERCWRVECNMLWPQVFMLIAIVARLGNTATEKY